MLRRITSMALICLLLPLSAFALETGEYTEPLTYDHYEDYEAAGLSQKVFFPEDVMDYEEIDRREEGLEMEGRIPMLNLYAGMVQYRINAQIEKTIAAKVAEARENRARTIYFDYGTYYSSSTSVMSIILKSTIASASSKTEVISINFNTRTGELLNAEDVVGSHVVQLANRLLEEMIRRNPEHYNPGFAGMRSDQAFSVTDDEIVFYFDEFQLAPGYEGVVTLRLELNNILEVVLMREQYHIRRQGFNLKMIPVDVLRGLGYYVDWDGYERKAFIYHNDELVIVLTSDVNNFVREERFTRSLEAPPEIITDGFLYVPISFFDQILSLIAFSIDEDDNIIFVSYPVTDRWFERQINP